MRGLFVAAVFCVVVSLTPAQAPPAAQNEKPKNPHADCPMHQAHAHEESTTSAMHERGEKGFQQPIISS
jgi:hypothetical protein